MPRLVTSTEFKLYVLSDEQDKRGKFKMNPLDLDIDREGFDGNEIEQTLMDSLGVIFGGHRVRGDCHECTWMLGDDMIVINGDDTRLSIENTIDVNAYPKHSRFYIVTNPRGNVFYWIVAVPCCTVYKG